MQRERMMVTTRIAALPGVREIAQVLRRAAVAGSLVLVVPVLLASSRPAAAQSAEILTLERAIEIALAQQPAVRRTRAEVDAAYGRVGLARVARRPTVALSATAGYGSTPPYPCSDDATRTCGGFFDPTASTGLGARGDWRIFDFGQTSANLRAAELGAEATATTEIATELDIRTAVEIAFLEAVARRRLVQVAEATVSSEDGHLDQAQRFVAAGTKDPIEIAQARARAASARSALARARSAEAIALANLRASIGLVDVSRSPVVAPQWPTLPADEPADLATLVAASRRQRPEIVQLDRAIAAAEASFDATVAERRPTLSATVTAQWNPDQADWSPQPSWTAGLTLSWQLLDGGRARAQQRIARAGVISAQAQRDALLVSLTSQLDAARAEILAGRAAVVASDEAVAAAREQLGLAEARYAQGLGSQIELADAQTAVTTAEGNLVLAQWQLAQAWANLHRQLGAR